MLLPPFTSLAWAYQLHYYLCFRTHRRQPFFANNAEVLTKVLAEVCQRHDYHLLGHQTYPDQLRCLVSLNPYQSVAKVIQIIKTNTSRESHAQLSVASTVWAGGYLARSVGKMRIGLVKNYLDNQSKHHGYDVRKLPPVFRYKASPPVLLASPHSIFNLNHHVVIATFNRQGLFTSSIGGALCSYWLKVAAKRGFAIDQLSMVPDHAHLILRTVPKLTIEECVVSLMNNGQHFIGQQYPHVLIDNSIDRLWADSAYAGTSGDVTTALIKHWLQSTHSRG